MSYENLALSCNGTTKTHTKITAENSCVNINVYVPKLLARNNAHPLTPNLYFLLLYHMFSLLARACF